MVLRPITRQVDRSPPTTTRRELSIQYLNSARTLFTYLSRGGETAFVLCEIREVQPEIPGFAARSAQGKIIEAFFVTEEWAALATWIIETSAGELGIALLLDVHGIPHRYPTGTGTAAVVSLAAACSDEQPTHHAA